VWALAHLLLLFAIAVVIAQWGERTEGVSGFIRLFFPAMLYPFFYRETQIAVHWIFPGFLDHQIVAFEHAVFGADPNAWLLPLQTGIVNETFMLGYFSYFWLIPVLALSLYFRKRQEDVSALLYATTAAFIISYMGFVLYPLEGPRYFLADRLSSPLDGWFFVPLVNGIVGAGAIHGGCMPSSHVAVALVVVVWARRTLPRLAVALTPFAVLLLVATVWGRFHYISDVVVGGIVGATALRLTGRRAVSPLRATGKRAGIDGARTPMLAQRRS
jgi:membrane-associated phospholipid phosphatase